MKIKRISTPDLQRWPVNSSRFLWPMAAIKGFERGKTHLILGFWIWRVDFVVTSNVKDEPRPL